MKSYKLKSLLIALFIPTLVLAQADFNLAGGNFKSFIGYVLSIVYVLIPILSVIAFIVFFWGLSKFILNSSKPEEITNGKNYMIWAVLALFILLTFRTIITLVSGDLEFGGNGYVIPQLRTGGGTPSVTTESDFRLRDGTVLQP